MTAIVDRVNLKIYDYSNYAHAFNVFSDEAKTVTALVLGYTAKLEFRDKINGTVLFTATTENGYLTVGNSTVTLEIPTSVVAGWSFTSALYDLFVISSTGKPTAVARGTVVVTPSVTHIP